MRSSAVARGDGVPAADVAIDDVASPDSHPTAPSETATEHLAADGEPDSVENDGRQAANSETLDELFYDRNLHIEHSNQYDSVSRVLPRDLVSPAILVFSKTNSYRHDSIDAANAMFREIANERGWGIFETENGAVFKLGRFKSVVWNNVSGDVLTPPQQEAFKSYIEVGGGFVGVHGSGGDTSSQLSTKELPSRTQSLDGGRPLDCLDALRW